MGAWAAWRPRPIGDRSRSFACCSPDHASTPRRHRILGVTIVAGGRGQPFRRRAAFRASRGGLARRVLINAQIAAGLCAYFAATSPLILLVLVLLFLVLVLLLTVVLK